MKISINIALLTFILLIAQGVSAQFYFGVNGGFPATSILNQNSYGFQEPDYTVTFGPSYGAAMGYQLSYNTGIVMNVNYVRQGQHYKDSFWDGDMEKEVNLDYISIPIMFEYLPGGVPSLVYLPSKAPQFYMLYGVQFGILQKAEVIQDWQGNVDDAPSLPNDSKTLFKSTDLSFVAEHGFQYFYNQKWFFNAGIRCVVGLVDINDPDYRVPVHRFNYLPEEPYKASRNATFGLNLTAAFLFGRKL